MHSPRLEEFALRHQSCYDRELIFKNSALSWNFLRPLIKSNEDFILCIGNTGISTGDIWNYFEALKTGSIRFSPFIVLNDFLVHMTWRKDLPREFYTLYSNTIFNSDYETLDPEYLLACRSTKLWVIESSHGDFFTRIFRNPRLTAQFLKKTYFDRYFRPFTTNTRFLFEIISNLNSNAGVAITEKQRILEYLGLWQMYFVLGLRDLPLARAEEIFNYYEGEIPARMLFYALHISGNSARLDYFLLKYPNFRSALLSDTGIFSALTHERLNRHRLYKTPWSLLQDLLGDLDETDVDLTYFLLQNKSVPVAFLLERTFPRDDTGEVHNGFYPEDLLRRRADLTSEIIEFLLGHGSEYSRDVRLCELMRNPHISWTLIEHYYPQIQEYLRSGSDYFTKHIKPLLSRNSNIPLCFFESHPEIIDWPALLKNKFTYQVHLDNNKLETTLAWNARLMLEDYSNDSSLDYSNDSLVAIVLNIVNEETQKLEHLGKLREVFPN